MWKTSTWDSAEQLSSWVDSNDLDGPLDLIQYQAPLWVNPCPSGMLVGYAKDMRRQNGVPSPDYDCQEMEPDKQESWAPLLRHIFPTWNWLLTYRLHHGTLKKSPIMSTMLCPTMSEVVSNGRVKLSVLKGPRGTASQQLPQHLSNGRWCNVRAFKALQWMMEWKVYIRTAPHQVSALSSIHNLLKSECGRAKQAMDCSHHVLICLFKKIQQGQRFLYDPSNLTISKWKFLTFWTKRSQKLQTAQGLHWHEPEMSRRVIINGDYSKRNASE